MRDLTEARRPLSPEELAALAAVVGEAHLLVARDDLEPYGRDWTEDFRAEPAAVARPRTTSEVSSLLKLCSERRIPVTPQAGRTGLSGGALPIRGGLVLSVERMSSILEIDEANLVAVAEAGVVTQELHEAVEARGLYYPPDPASRASCRLGGNVAENAGGPHATKYGVTSKWVMGLEAVLASGEVLLTGGKTRKDVAGYDLTSLLVGSEGTLAVVTKAWLRLIPKPGAAAVVVAPFATLEEAAAAVAAISRAGLVPAALEIVDRPCVDVSFRKKGLPVPFPEAEARLLVELDGADDAEVERDVTRCGEVLLEAGPSTPSSRRTRRSGASSGRCAAGSARPSASSAPRASSTWRCRAPSSPRSSAASGGSRRRPGSRRPASATPATGTSTSTSTARGGARGTRRASRRRPARSTPRRAASAGR